MHVIFSPLIFPSAQQRFVCCLINEYHDDDDDDDDDDGFNPVSSGPPHPVRII